MAGEVASAEVIWRRYDAMEARLSAGLSERMLDLDGVVRLGGTTRIAVAVR